jgi:hypothetical protein
MAMTEEPEGDIFDRIVANLPAAVDAILESVDEPALLPRG